MKFLLIDSQGYSSFVFMKKIKKIRTSIYPPLGLLYIGRSLEDEGHEVELIDFNNEVFPRKFEKILASVDAVGLNICSNSYKFPREIAERIKEIDSSIPIIIGGPHCTFHPKRSLEDIPSADISIEGEGDFAIKNIAKFLEFGRKELSDIEGVFYRKNNNIKAGRPHKIIKDLDSLPFPARHLVDKYEYGIVNGKYLYKPKFASMVSSRGCPFNCCFCTRSALVYKTFRQRSAENVVKEILEVDNKYKTLCIVDDNFLKDKKRADRIMDSLIEEGTDLDLFVMGARVDSADRRLYKKMKKAGVKYVNFGLESGNQDVLDYYKKRITPKQIRKAVNLAREMNFITQGNFILGAPLETEKHFEKTIKFACSLPLDIVIFNPLTYMYGSDLWDDAIKMGIKPKDNGYALGPEALKKLGNFSYKELIEFCQKAVKRFYFRPNYIMDQLLMSIKRKNLRLLQMQLSSLVK